MGSDTRWLFLSSRSRFRDVACGAAAGRQPFGSPLVLSRVHWVRVELVAEVKYLTSTDGNLLRQVVYEGLGEDAPSGNSSTHPKPAAAPSHDRSLATAAYLSLLTSVAGQLDGQDLGGASTFDERSRTAET
jgi:hypothetical protein